MATLQSEIRLHREKTHAQHDKFWFTFAQIRWLYESTFELLRKPFWDTKKGHWGKII